MARTKLYILRHGEAQMQAATDAARQLTNFGRRQARAQAACFKPELALVEQVYVSPFLRAQQTADELFAELSGATNACRHEAAWLTPDVAIEQVIRGLEPVIAGAPVLLVSHQPLVSQLISFLSDTPVWQVSMDTASLAYLEVSVLAKGLAELKSITPALVPR
ncbi:phosphohistidine phosphatase SixA [Simiduia curdlanivorans]|uniref:Phosphohistidine phosphatase SixA n=1 Tax=Simiduia curdlanivorans TaxID=1492769 RepID=A0ABV8V1Q0_9GAMM|nr:phosphohistidine phosphatase SixA [Simiduia curdlanivorans]MDN3640038.1 phosphohistidine phosphatase SixA [Simiduia curdlanivorans]